MDITSPALTLAQRSVLAVLPELEAGATVAELAQLMGWTRESTLRLLWSLARIGLVRYAAHPLGGTLWWTP